MEDETFSLERKKKIEEKRNEEKKTESLLIKKTFLQHAPSSII